MSYLSTFFVWLFTGSNGFMFAASSSALAFMVMIACFLFKAIRKVDLSLMLFEPGTREVSSTKFWHVVACFIATIAFLFINVTVPGSASLEFIWLTYLGVIAGSASVSKLISAKYSATPVNQGIVMREAMSAPQYTQYGEPIYQPAYSQPSYSQPGYAQPAYSQPTVAPEPGFAQKEPRYD